MDGKELHELLDRIGKLPVAEQVFVMEMIAAGLRKQHFTDHEAEAKKWAEFVEEWTAQGGERYPYPIPDDLSADQLPPDLHAPR